MKLLKIIWNIIILPFTLVRFVYLDLKRDVQFIRKAWKRMDNNESVFDPEKKAAIVKEFTTGWNAKWFMKSLPFFLIIILAFIVGYNYGGFKCNMFFVETYGDQIVDSSIHNITQAINNLTW